MMLCATGGCDEGTAPREEGSRGGEGVGYQEGSEMLHRNDVGSDDDDDDDDDESLLLVVAVRFAVVVLLVLLLGF